MERLSAWVRLSSRLWAKHLHVELLVLVIELRAQAPAAGAAREGCWPAFGRMAKCMPGEMLSGHSPQKPLSAACEAS